MGQEQNWTSTALHFQRSTDADCYLVAAKVMDTLSGSEGAAYTFDV